MKYECRITVLETVFYTILFLVELRFQKTEIQNGDIRKQ